MLVAVVYCYMMIIHISLVTNFNSVRAWKTNDKANDLVVAPRTP